MGIGNYGGEGWSEKKNKQTIQQFKQQTNKKQFRLNKVDIFSTVILASHSFLQFVAFWCRSAFIEAFDWFVLPI